MDVVYLLIPLALVLVALGFWAFLWAVRTGQFDDLESQGTRVLFEDEDEKPDEK